MQYLKTLEPPEEVCIINDMQKRGTTFPVSIEGRHTKIDSIALMDTGATRGCMNYSTAYKLGKNDVKQFETTQGWEQMAVIWGQLVHCNVKS